MPLITHPRNGPSLIHCEPVSKARPIGMADIEAIAAKLEPGLRKVLFDALQSLSDGVDLAALVDAIKTGSTANVVSVLEAFAPKGWAAAVENALVNAVTGAGVLAAADIARLTRVDFRFGVLNPQLVSWMQSYSFGLIAEIGNRTREGIRAAAIAGMKDGRNPIDVARDIKAIVGLTDRQTKAVANYRKELETFHLKRTAPGWGVGKPIDRVNGRQVLRVGEDGEPKDGIAERRLRDFRFDAKLQAALDTKKPLDPKVIDKMVDAYARKYRRYRSEMIARTEAMRATNMGVQDAWRQAVDANVMPEGLLRRRWIVGKDERTCEACNSVPRLNPKIGVKFKQPFATQKGPVHLPPLHPNCRCTVVVRLMEPSQVAE